MNLKFFIQENWQKVVGTGVAVIGLIWAWRKFRKKLKFNQAKRRT